MACRENTVGEALNVCRITIFLRMYSTFFSRVINAHDSYFEVHFRGISEIIEWPSRSIPHVIDVNNLYKKELT